MFALAFLLLAGCAGGQPAFGEPREPVTISFWKFQSNKEDYIVNDWINQWNIEHTDIQVQIEFIPYNDYLSVALATAFATNSAPDVYMISAGSFMKYANAGYMLPLDDFLGDELKKDILPARLDAAKKDGKILGMPIEIEPVGLFYNKEIFEQKSMPPPKTWEDMLECARLLDGESMAGIQLPTQPNDYQNFIFYTFFLQAGGSFDFSQGDPEPPLRTSLDFWRRLSGYVQPAQSTVQIPSDIYPLATGETAMQVCGYWSVRMLEKHFPDFSFGVVPVPVPENGVDTSVYGGWFQIVNPLSEHAAEAAEFTVWMWGEDESRPLAWCREVSSKLPVRQSVIDHHPEEFSSPADQIFIHEILPSSTPEPRLTPEIAKAFEDAIQDAMFTNREIQDIARETAVEILRQG